MWHGGEIPDGGNLCSTSVVTAVNRRQASKDGSHHSSSLTSVSYQHMPVEINPSDLHYGRFLNKGGSSVVSTLFIAPW